MELCLGQAPNPGPLSEWGAQKKSPHNRRHGPRSEEAACYADAAYLPAFNNNAK